jgi:hypothetical protein
LFLVSQVNLTLYYIIFRPAPIKPSCQSVRAYMQERKC